MSSILKMGFQSLRISSLQGDRNNPVTHKDSYHAGIDIVIPVGTPVYNPVEGIVTDAGESDVLGIYSRIVTGGVERSYCHLNELNFKVGDVVPEGAVVGYSGSTGQVTGPHLHYSVRDGERWLDAFEDFVMFQKQETSDSSGKSNTALVVGASVISVLLTALVIGLISGKLQELSSSLASKTRSTWFSDLLLSIADVPSLFERRLLNTVSLVVDGRPVDSQSAREIARRCIGRVYDVSGRGVCKVNDVDFFGRPILGLIGYTEKAILLETGETDKWFFDGRLRSVRPIDVIKTVE